MSKPKNPIDMQRPLALYAVTIGLLLMLALMVSNIPGLALSTYFEIPYRKIVSASLIGLGTVAGALALLCYQARVDRPWQVHQTQVTVLYTAFVALSAMGILAIR